MVRNRRLYAVEVNQHASAKRVCVFPGLLRVGGTVRVMLNLAEGMVERGLAVDLFLTHPPGELEYMVPAGVNVVLGRNGNVASARSLAGYLGRHRPDALISAHHAPNIVSVVARAMARVPTRVVLTVHTQSASRHGGRLRNALMARAMRWSYRRAHAVVAVSDAIAGELAREVGVPRRLIKVIPNPTITRLMLERAADPVDHPWLSATGELPVVLGVGRLSKEKDFQTLLRAFASARRQVPARLLILGEGAERAALERLVADLGLKDEAELPGIVQNPLAYMQRAALVALSSRSEGLPSVLVEAMAVGTPVVSTECSPAVVDLLDEGRLGAVVPVGDIDGLASAIVATLSRDAPRTELMERGRSFSAERAVAEYLDLLGPQPRA